MGIVIYKITSPIGLVYIGQTRNFKKRMYCYNTLNCKNQTKLYESFLKYGFDNHTVNILHWLPNDVEHSIINNYEKLYFELYVFAGLNTLNCKTPGDAISKEGREKISNFWKGRKRSEKQKLEQSKRMKGRPSRRKGIKSSEESKRKMSESRKGKNPHTPEHMKKLHASRKGVPMPREAIERMMKTRLERGSYKKLSNAV